MTSKPGRSFATPLGLLAQLDRTQAQLALAGIVLLVIAVPTGLALMVDPRTLAGVGVWIKPLKFQLSIAIHLVTLAILMLLLPSEQLERRLVRVLVGVVLVCAAFEISYIMFQAGRGEASHFNTATPIAAFMYGLMGIAAVTILAASALIGVLILRHGPRGNPIVLGAGLGLALGSVLGAATGLFLGGQPGHSVGGDPIGADGLPIVGWSRTGGDLRVAHFVGLHMTQALPLAAWLGSLVLPQRLMLPAILTVVALGVLLTWLAWSQAVSGAPLIAV